MLNCCIIFFHEKTPNFNFLLISQDLKEEMQGLDKGLKDLYDHYDNAMAEYEFVKEILEVGFTVRNFEHELKILENVISVLDSIYDEFVVM